MSTSFVTEVLATAGRFEVADINTKLRSLSKRIEEVKVEVHDALQRKYIDFYPNLDTTVELSRRVSTLAQEMENVGSKVEKEIKSQMNVSTAEFKDLSVQLEESNAILTIVDKLLKSSCCLSAANQATKNKDYVAAANALTTCDEVLRHPDINQENRIHVLRGLRDAYLLQKTKLLSDITGCWEESLVWVIDDSRKNGIKSVTLQITKGADSREILANTVQALFDLQVLDSYLKKFANRLMKDLIGLLIQHPSINCTIANQEKFVSFKVDVSGHPEKNMTPVNVFVEFLKLFKYLNENLFSLKITLNKASGSEEDGENSMPLMAKLGKLIGPEFLELILKDSLALSIPNNSLELEKYDAIVQLTTEFQEKLVALHFIDKNDSTLTDYVENVNVLFANKKSQELLSQAQALMTSDIHNMVEISGEEPAADLTLSLLQDAPSKTMKNAENIALTSDLQLSPNTFRLPSCFVSTAVKSLMQLAYDTLHEASKSKDACAIQLFYAVWNMFELFCTVVPTYHKDKLANLPQLSALFHNDCMYVSNYLMILGHQFQPQLPAFLNEGGATFIDLVPRMRRLGTECFLQQMKRQRAQLTEYLSGASGFASVSEENNFQKAERAIKQVLHQLKHLKKVWIGVLPIRIYSKSIGTLLNSCLLEIINQVIVLEDISAEDATQLYSLMYDVTQHAPELFPDTDDASSREVQLHKQVQKWTKFKELMVVLNASLQDILDRWASGKGPLAHEFSANEIKQMVRALFQNTDRRAAVLVNIK